LTFILKNIIVKNYRKEVEMFFPNRFFIDPDHPTQAMSRLLDILQIPHDGNIFSIRDITQREWYQKEKKRSEIEEQEKYLRIRDKLMPIFVELGLVDPVYAKRLNYETALIHGGTLSAVQKRIAFLAKEWERGVRFKKIGFLCSERKIIKEKEEISKIEKEVFGVSFDVKNCKNYDNEFKMMCSLYSISKLPWQREISQLLVFVGNEKANTEDTVRGWYESFNREISGPLLFVSSQPFVFFQDIIVRKVILDKEVDTIGYQASPNIPLATYLDNIAKVIFELAKISSTPR
jgi:hypothetical protein